MPKKESRKAVERQNAERKQQRLAYIGTLAAGLAHEIRNPLNSIKINVDLIRGDLGGLPEEEARNLSVRLERISRETGQLQSILDEFLTFARPPRMELMVTDLNQYLEDLISFFEPECSKSEVVIRKEFAENPYPVRIDPVQFKQVIMNIFKNALEAIGQHGEIAVSTCELEREVEIKITDNGGGIPLEESEKIFEVFYSSKERGTGLGLAIARRIVEEHGGRLILENRPGLGASFVINLPKGIFLEFEDKESNGVRKQ